MLYFFHKCVQVGLSALSPALRIPCLVIQECWAGKALSTVVRTYPTHQNHGVSNRLYPHCEVSHQKHFCKEERMHSFTPEKARLPKCTKKLKLLYFLLQNTTMFYPLRIHRKTWHTNFTILQYMTF